MNRKQVLKNIYLSFFYGAKIGIIGLNGSGKSTLLRLITGIYKPDKGSVSIDDVVPFDNPDIKANVAYVPDDLYFTPGATINKMRALYKSVYKDFDDERCKELAEKFNLDVNRPLTTFSKGMKRQAIVICAIACCTKYLFLDEAFDGVPFLSPVEEAPGLILACGFTGHGFGTAPAVGLMLAQMAMGQETVVDISALRYDRFKPKR